jgi:hypothetical protein
MKWLLPLVWLLRLGGKLASKERKEAYRLEETLTDEIIMGGNTLIVIGEKA